ncbi:MAG: hypothetical protein ACKOCT_02170 [Alphaproteobacteria bacterium]
MTPPAGRLDDRSPGAWAGGRLDDAVLAVVFVASRIFVDRVLGLHFDPSALVWCMQFLDPVLLRDDLARSLWWLHAQPPLFNLFLGLGVKAFSERGPGFGLLFRAASLALVLALHALLRRLGVRRGWALGACLLFLASPALFYCECWLYYTLFEALLLVLTCLGFARMVARPTTGRFAEFLAWPTLLCLLRSTFQPAWLAAMALVPLVTLPGLRRARAVWAVLFLLLLPPLAWCAKNAAVFGFFGTSSWAGMHLMRVAGADVTPDEKRGRVMAVENVFIGASNELGAFESGMVGQALGVPTAVIGGGVATVAIVGIWWVSFPALRNVDRFDELGH